MEPKEFFSRLLAKRGLNPNSLAEMLGADGGSAAQSTFQRFKAGKTEQPRHSTMKVVADRLGVDVQAFYDAQIAEDEAQRLNLTDRHPGHVAENRPVYSVHEQPSEIPSIGRIEGALRVLSESTAGGLTCTVLPVVDFQGMDMSQKNDSLATLAIQWLTAPGEFSKYAKIAAMPDDSMFPEIHAGELVAFDPKAEADLGDIVLISDDHGGLWIRQFRPLPGGRFDAVALNPALHAPLRSGEDGVKVVAVLVGHWRGRRAKRH